MAKRVSKQVPGASGSDANSSRIPAVKRGGQQLTDNSDPFGARVGRLFAALVSKRVAHIVGTLASAGKFIGSRIGHKIAVAVWYLPAGFALAVALTALASPSAALVLFLCGCIFFAGVLFYVARLIRRRYLELLARMPKIDGQAPKRLEIHAVILGVGERRHSDSITEDFPADFDIASDAFVGDEAGADRTIGPQRSRTLAGDSSAGDSGAFAANDSDSANDRDHPYDDADDAGNPTAYDDMSAFEMFEVPVLRRERNRKTMVH